MPHPMCQDISSAQVIASHRRMLQGGEKSALAQTAGRQSMHAKAGTTRMGTEGQHMPLMMHADGLQSRWTAAEGAALRSAEVLMSMHTPHLPRAQALSCYTVWARPVLARSPTPTPSQQAFAETADTVYNVSSVCARMCPSLHAAAGTQSHQRTGGDTLKMRAPASPTGSSGAEATPSLRCGHDILLPR